VNSLWFEDELEPSQDASRNQSGEKGPPPSRISEAARGVVRALEPRWESLGEAPLTSGVPARLWRVRLWFEFEPKSESSTFAFARCEAYLIATGTDEPQPSVYDLYPRDLYEGVPQVVSLNFGPSLKVAGAEASVGKLSTDISIGKVAPVTVGYAGENGRFPHWELRAKKHPLEGIRNLWLIIAQPRGCNGIRLSARVEGVIQTHWGPVPVYPKKRDWDNRPSVAIR